MHWLAACGLLPPEIRYAGVSIEGTEVDWQTKSVETAYNNIASFPELESVAILECDDFDFDRAAVLASLHHVTSLRLRSSL
jgi:hypothetical protein